MLPAPGRRSGFTLIEILFVVLLIGILGTLAVNGFHGMQDSSSNVACAGNARTVSMALERYRSDRGTLPMTLNGMADTALCQGGGGSSSTSYLPGNRLPLSAYAQPQFPQTGADIAFPGAWVDANTAATGNPKPASMIGMVIATPGKIPTAVTYAQDFYGVIQYSRNTMGDLYVVTSTGRRGRSAIVVEALTNAN